MLSYSWPLNNKGLNCMGPLIHGYFSIVNTLALHGPCSIESSDEKNHGNRGPNVSYIRINPHIFRGSTVHATLWSYTVWVGETYNYVAWEKNVWVLLAFWSTQCVSLADPLTFTSHAVHCQYLGLPYLGSLTLIAGNSDRSSAPVLHKCEVAIKCLRSSIA